MSSLLNISAILDSKQIFGAKSVMIESAVLNCEENNIVKAVTDIAERTYIDESGESREFTAKNVRLYYDHGGFISFNMSRDMNDYDHGIELDLSSITIELWQQPGKDAVERINGMEKVEEAS